MYFCAVGTELETHDLDCLVTMLVRCEVGVLIQYLRQNKQFPRQENIQTNLVQTGPGWSMKVALYGQHHIITMDVRVENEC